MGLLHTHCDCLACDFCGTLNSGGASHSSACSWDPFLPTRFPGLDMRVVASLIVSYYYALSSWYPWWVCSFLKDYKLMFPLLAVFCSNFKVFETICQAHSFCQWQTRVTERNGPLHFQQDPALSKQWMMTASQFFKAVTETALGPLALAAGKTPWSLCWHFIREAGTAGEALKNCACFYLNF